MAADGYIGLFQVPDYGSVKVIIDGKPTLSVTEQAVSFSPGTGGVSTADLTITFSGDAITAGVITDVVSIYKQSGATEWSRKLHKVKWDDTFTGSDHIFIEGLETDGVSAINYDFRVWFLNGDNQYANDGTADITEDSNYLEAASQSFDGVSDLSQLIEADNVLCTNSGVTDNDGDPTTPVAVPTENIKLKWDNMLKAPTGTYGRVDTDGSRDSDTVTRLQWKTLQSYVVYMFISDEGTTLHPQNNFPSADDTNGTWYEVAETTANTIELSMPHNKYVGFWVGCRLKGSPGVTGVSVS